MMKNKIISILFLFNFVFSYNDIPDLVTKVATTSGNWLKLETGARAVGMGGAQVAAGTGIAAVSYNPASIAFINKHQAYYSKSSLYSALKASNSDAVSINTIALGTKLTNTDFIALNLFYMDSGNILRTDAHHPNGELGYYNVTSLCLRGTYARILTDRLKVGVSLKYIREQIWTASYQSFAVDIGSNFNTGIYGVVLGMSVTNFGPDVRFYGEGLNIEVPDTTAAEGVLSQVTEEFPIPMTFRCGIKKDIMINTSHRFTIAADGINPIDYTVHCNIGAEYSWKELAYIRFGTHLMHDTASFTIGGGAKIKNINIDYAMANYGILDLTHQFGLTFGY